MTFEWTFYGKKYQSSRVWITAVAWKLLFLILLKKPQFRFYIRYKRKTYLNRFALLSCTYIQKYMQLINTTIRTIDEVEVSVIGRFDMEWFRCNISMKYCIWVWQKSLFYNSSKCSYCTRAIRLTAFDSMNIGNRSVVGKHVTISLR